MNPSNKSSYVEGMGHGAKGKVHGVYLPYAPSPMPYAVALCITI